MGAPARGRALVVHPGSLGDVLLARPALRVLRAAPTPCEVVLVAGHEVGGLLLAAGEVQEVWPLEGPVLAELLSGAGFADASRRRVAAGCDLALCWLADRDGQVRAGLERLGVGVVIVASPHAPAGSAVHQSERFLRTVCSGARTEVAPGGLRLPSALLQAGREQIRQLTASREGPVVIVHPGSGSRLKCSPPSLLATVLDRLRADGVAPLLVSGPADAAIVSEVRAHLRGSVPVAAGLSLRALAGLLSAAQGYVGHDSGVTHLAAALNLPVVALFGPTDPRRWAPRGRRVRVLTGAPCRCRGWEEVRSCAERSCLSIPEQEVVSACRDLLHPALPGSAEPAAGSGAQLEVPPSLC